MYFYIMINYRKIRCKNKSKENYLKVPLKEVGTISPKKYSSIIVNDIKMDFSMFLSKKFLNLKPVINYAANNKTYLNLNRLNSKRIEPERKINIMRDKSAEIRRNNVRNNKNNYTYVKPKPVIYDNKKIYTKKKAEKTRLSKTPISNKFGETLTVIEAINRIKNIKKHFNEKIIKNKEDTINKTVIEKQEKSDLDNNQLTQKVPYARINTFDKKQKNVIIEEYFKSDNDNGIIAKNKTLENNMQSKINREDSAKNNTQENNLTLLSDIIEPSKRSNLRQISRLIKKNTIDFTNLKEIFLEPSNEPKTNAKNKNYRETFCEGFFICSFPLKKGQVVEKSQSFPALCGHPECSSLPSMKPEIIFRYPLTDTKNLELNNLAATICFPTGIKVCYRDEGQETPKPIEDYVTQITNQKGERYYMVNYHFYLKMESAIYNNKYEMHPLKDHLKRFADDYLEMNENVMNKKRKKIEEDLEQAQQLGFMEYVYIPFCICLISKYPYVDEIKNCLQSIYYLIIEKPEDNKKLEKQEIKKNKSDLINKLIMHLIDSVPIPEIETMVQFYIPYNKANKISIKYPKLNDLKIMNASICDLLKFFPIDLIIYIFRFLLLEKRILFIDDDYTRLSITTDNFISLIYPFQWIHTYIPIMSDQMLQYLETFLPFINGINTTLLPFVKDLYKTGDMEQNEEIFLIYITEKKFRLGTSLIGKGKKKYKYVEENVPSLPNNLEKGLRNKLKKIKEEIENCEKKKKGIKDMEDLEMKIRCTFIEFFVEMFHDIYKYLCFLDEDIVFNKNLFMEKIPKNDQKFFDEFLDTQLFQLFTQNIVKDEFNYFKLMMEDYNNNYGQFTYDNEKAGDDKIFSVKKKYIIPPDYLNITDKNILTISDKLNLNYNFQEKETYDKKIAEYMQEIEEKNYEKNILKIYKIPKETISTKIKYNENLVNNILTNKNNQKFIMSELKKYTKISRKTEMSPQEQDELKERIKDFTIKIFKSEEIDTENNNIRKEILNDLNTNFGREFFVNLISKNTNNIILLKNDFFSLLGNIIYNILLSILKIEETNKILEEIVRLLKSLKFFAKEDQGDICIIIKGKKKCTLTLWDLYEQRIQGYSKVNQENLWKKWYKINLENEKDQDKPDTKKKVILGLLDIMFELELDITFIKKTIESIMNKALKGDEKRHDEIMQAIQKIYLEKNKKKKKNN